ncbi:MAG: ATP synthase complex assembly protein atp12 [Stictis urceolatum]|nr:ATP synthase complex assembly protein atp12 [Stictis urceolata]
MPRIRPIIPPIFSTASNPRVSTRPSSFRCLHSSAARHANPLPVTATGPPPEPPQPAVTQYGERVDRKRRQAELVKEGQRIRAAQSDKPSNALKKRFWKDVSVKEAPEGHLTINLDARPVRHPSTKSTLPIPPSKPHLATAIALEWDLLVTAQQALKTHLIPLTSLASRAHDIALQDAGSQSGTARTDIVASLMRYLDTDTLLCWAPSKSNYPEPMENVDGSPQESLREVQVRTALPILSFLTTRVWPGVEIRPVLGESIIPASQAQETLDVIRGWISGLGPYELAGLERAVLAGKSLCVAARLVAEWSENLAGLREGMEKEKRFGVEEAAEACSLEVNWQTGRWGEVEDTHDVEKEDVRRQFGSTVLLVSGVGSW